MRREYSNSIFDILNIEYFLTFNFCTKGPLVSHGPFLLSAYVHEFKSVNNTKRVMKKERDLECCT